MKPHVIIAAGVLALAGAGVMLWRHDVSSAQARHAVESPARPSRPQDAAAKPKYLPQIEVITDAGLHWEERIEAVRALPDQLGEASTGKLFDFLGHAPETGKENWYLVCNEIMEVLRKRNLAPEVYAQKHLALIQSATADPVIRDYAAQHLAQWISGANPAARESDAQLAARAFDEMAREAAKPENGQLTLVGTTLNALADTVVRGDDAMRDKREQVGQLALQIFSTADGSISTANRSTALQAAARLKVPGLSDVCRRTLSNKQEPADVRLSSIAALGQVGGAEDLPTLQEYADDEIFKYAATAAIQRLNRATTAP